MTDEGKSYEDRLEEARSTSAVAYLEGQKELGRDPVEDSLKAKVWAELGASTIQAGLPIHYLVDQNKVVLPWGQVTIDHPLLKGCPEEMAYLLVERLQWAIRRWTVQLEAHKAGHPEWERDPDFWRWITGKPRPQQEPDERTWAPVQEGPDVRP